MTNDLAPTLDASRMVRSVASETADRAEITIQRFPAPVRREIRRLIRTHPRAADLCQTFPGLLYAIARVLAKNRINLQLAKVSTLGERVEDTFLVDGPALQQPKAQLRIESELLDAVAAPAT